MLSTRYHEPHQTLNARLIHAWDMFLKQNSRSVHVVHTGVPKMCAKGVQSVFKAPVTCVELIQNIHVHDTRPRHVKLAERI